MLRKGCSEGVRRRTIHRLRNQCYRQRGRDCGGDCRPKGESESETASNDSSCGSPAPLRCRTTLNYHYHTTVPLQVQSLHTRLTPSPHGLPRRVCQGGVAKTVGMRRERKEVEGSGSGGDQPKAPRGVDCTWAHLKWRRVTEMDSWSCVGDD